MKSCTKKCSRGDGVVMVAESVAEGSRSCKRPSYVCFGTFRRVAFPGIPHALHSQICRLVNLSSLARRKYLHSYKKKNSKVCVLRHLSI